MVVLRCEQDATPRGEQLGKIVSSIKIRRVCKVDVKSAFRRSGEIDYAIGKFDRSVTRFAKR